MEDKTPLIHKVTWVLEVCRDVVVLETNPLEIAQTSGRLRGADNVCQVGTVTMITCVLTDELLTLADTLCTAYNLIIPDLCNKGPFTLGGYT